MSTDKNTTNFHWNIEENTAFSLKKLRKVKENKKLGMRVVAIFSGLLFSGNSIFSAFRPPQ